MTDRRGCPVAISDFGGDTGEPTTFLPQVRKLRDALGLEQMVFIGDHGMISRASIAELRAEDFGWITRAYRRRAAAAQSLVGAHGIVAVHRALGHTVPMT